MEIYLQKRSAAAKLRPGYFGFFGGHAEEGETPEETLEREIKEELDFIPKGYSLLERYESGDFVGHYYLLKVPDNFLKIIKVLEGDYGKFFNEKDVSVEERIFKEDKMILRRAFQMLRGSTEK